MMHFSVWGFFLRWAWRVRPTRRERPRSVRPRGVEHAAVTFLTFARMATHRLVSLAPRLQRATSSELSSLVDHIARAKRLLVITGAGVSTGSGIPDYRSANGSYSRGHKPMQHAEFVRSEKNRRRYWTRSFVGWRYFSRAEPNAAHVALAELESYGFVQGGLITQNVDGLHAEAGMRNVLDLHGRIGLVECLSCGDITPRARLQERLRAANEAWAASIAPLLPGELRADGDSEIEEADDFVVPSCERCHEGVLKPNVTFFGGSVPVATVQAAADAVAHADALLVLGSSMQVFSAFRLARQAAREGKPIAILNNGPTRADELACLHVAADVCAELPDVVAALR